MLCGSPTVTSTVPGCLLCHLDFPKAHQRGSQAAHRVPLPACGRPEAWPWLRLFCNFYAFRSVCLLSQHLTTVFDKPRRGSILHHNTSRPAALRSSRPAARLPLIVTPMRLDTFSVYGGSGGQPKFVKSPPCSTAVSVDYRTSQCTKFH